DFSAVGSLKLFVCAGATFCDNNKHVAKIPRLLIESVSFPLRMISVACARGNLAATNSLTFAGAVELFRAPLSLFGVWRHAKRSWTSTRPRLGDNGQGQQTPTALV